ncbi:MAG TPA: hypothetical protein VHB54_16720 [Mucilaginibacter sp.]|nr:hypothetical protein [Mucilaginibacter sp.]
MEQEYSDDPPKADDAEKEDDNDKDNKEPETQKEPDDKKKPEPIKAPSGERISDFKLDEILIKKKGFLITLSTSPAPQELLEAELVLIKEKYKDIISDLKKLQQERIANYNDWLILMEKRGHELEHKRQTYSARIDSLDKEREELQVRLQDLYRQVIETIKQLGIAKEKIVKTSLEDIQRDLEKMMSINSEMQNRQNDDLEQKYKKDEKSITEKIEFWKGILVKHQEQYQKVTERLKLLSKDGVNSQTAHFLIGLGSLSALVSGWWFSLWTGPQAGAIAGDNVSGNTSVKFFFLDNIGKFLSGYSLIGMISIILVYVAIIGAISWICHWSLIRFGFIIDFSKARQNKGKPSDEANDNFELNTDDQENMLHAKIRSTAWLGLWLKITPIILALLPILGVISIQISEDMKIAGAGNHNNFQGLFDSLINEFIGTAIAAIFSVFTILYLTRVSENEYYKHEQGSERTNQGFRPNIQYIGFLLFALMILAMLLYHYPILFFDDIRRIAVFGFIVSCLATGFSIGYGYIFNGLKNNSDMLLFYIDSITNIIQNLSKPYRVNYTTNWSLRARIYQLQQKMFDLIEGRQELANDISCGRESSDAMVLSVVVPRSQSKPVEKENQSSNEKDRNNYWDRLYHWIFRKDKKKADKSDGYLDDMSLSQNDLKYFSESAAFLKELYNQIQEIKERQQIIDEEQDNRLINKGKWQSATDQIKNNEQEIIRIKRQKEEIILEEILEVNKLSGLETREITLLKEGYYTGLWFRDAEKLTELSLNP